MSGHLKILKINRKRKFNFNSSTSIVIPALDIASTLPLSSTIVSLEEEDSLFRSKALLRVFSFFIRMQSGSKSS